MRVRSSIDIHWPLGLSVPLKTTVASLSSDSNDFHNFHKLFPQSYFLDIFGKLSCFVIQQRCAVLPIRQISCVLIGCGRSYWYEILLVMNSSFGIVINISCYIRCCIKYIWSHSLSLLNIHLSDGWFVIGSGNRLPLICYLLQVTILMNLPSLRHITLQWRYNERDCVSNCHVSIVCSAFRCRSKKTSKLRVTGLYEGNSPVTGNNAEIVSIWWRHHEINVHYKFPNTLNVSTPYRTVESYLLKDIRKLVSMKDEWMTC